MDYFTTGEVAKKLNMSLRTLRYYDQIQLVVPTLKDDNGKRFYSNEDLLLLQKITLSKEASMSLKDIEQIINDVSIDKVLALHKTQLEEKISQLQQSFNHTQTLLNMLKIEGSLQWTQLLPLFTESKQQNTEQKQLLINQFFKEDEQALLEEKLPKMEDSHDDISKWINLIKRIEICLAENKAASSPDGQLIAEDILILSKEIFGDNQQLIDSFWQVRKDDNLSSNMQLYPIKKEVLQFVEDCITYFEKTK